MRDPSIVRDHLRAGRPVRRYVRMPPTVKLSPHWVRWNDPGMLAEVNTERPNVIWLGSLPDATPDEIVRILAHEGLHVELDQYPKKADEEKMSKFIDHYPKTPGRRIITTQTIDELGLPVRFVHPRKKRRSR